MRTLHAKRSHAEMVLVYRAVIIQQAAFVQSIKARERNPAADQRVLGQKIKPDLKYYPDLN
jgi:hypothetical protein